MDGNRTPLESGDIELPSRMDVVREFYYRWNMRFLVLVGLWPYSSAKVKFVQHIVVGSALIIGVLAQAGVLVNVQVTVELLLTTLPTLTISMSVAVKYLTHWALSAQLRQILEHIKRDWNDIDSTAEFAIIIKRANKWQYCMKVFGLFIATPAGIVLSLIPLSSLILDAIAPLDEPRHMLQPAPIRCPFSCDDHRILTIISTEWMIWLTIMNFIATETTVAMWLQHLSALLALTRFRIKEAFLPQELGPMHSEKSICKCLIRAILMHQNALIFANRLKEILLPMYFPQVGLGIVTLTINLYRISRSLLISYDTDDLLIGLFLSLALLSYIFYLNFLVQQAVDSYSEVFVELYNTNWYEVPLSMQKLLLFIMLNTAKPINFMFYGLFDPSIRGFSMLIQTSASYFMVLYSYQSQQM